MDDYMGEKNNTPFKESKLIPSAATYVILAFLFSAVPEWSKTIFIMNSIVAGTALLITVIYWKVAEYKRRYFSVASYCLLFTISFTSVQPVLRVSWAEGNSLWMYLGFLWIVTFMVTHILKEGIFQAFSKTFESRFSISFHIVLFGVLFTAPIVIFLTNLESIFNQNTQFFLLGMLLYVISLFLLIMLPALLKHPKDIIKERNPGVRPD
ncbi:hypothetical protein D3H55_19025 [Bacillus salacetis]|uniref:Uncharacterized protein n=1 Tax=Bacillus salacetis TaxID=2315464 RepID=A0A3A1QR31_9BACI|nr:hypothetical protein [Bacillus salacetis]RIW29357.1 hypothetical protein D3H55_19025 [Bacillus salacetis]